jgi:hypothetical protein
MPHHPVRVLSERGASFQEIAPLFAPDVVFNTPLLAKPARGREIALGIFARALSYTGIKYTQEFTNDQQTVLLWNGTMKGYQIQGATVLSEDTEGHIYEITMFMRPYPVVTLLWEAMRAEATLPKDFWELAPLAPEVPILEK